MGRYRSAPTAAVTANVQDVEDLLTLIKGTDGVKKIADVLHTTNPSIYGGGQADLFSYVPDKDAIPDDVAYCLYNLSFLHGWEDLTDKWHRLRLDNDKVLSVNTPNRSSFAVGTKHVAAAGTGEVMPTVAVPNGFKVTIKAKHTNTGLVYIADTKLKSETVNARFILRANESLSLKVTNLNKLWVNSSVNAEGVEYLVEI